jgi:hypothetical protein
MNNKSEVTVQGVLPGFSGLVFESEVVSSRPDFGREGGIRLSEDQVVHEGKETTSSDGPDGCPIEGSIFH